MTATPPDATPAHETADHTLLLHPRDPIILRDARPFSADPGARAVTLGWPLPQTLAGALRTHIGNALNWNWQQRGPDDARRFGLRGPFLVGRADSTHRWTVYLPAPADAVPYNEEETGKSALLCLRPGLPLPSDQGCTPPAFLSAAAMRRFRPLAIKEDVKESDERPRFWSLDDTLAWLKTPRKTEPPKDTVNDLPRDTRVHVGINPETGTHRAGALFTTTALSFGEDGAPSDDGDRRSLALLCRLVGAPASWPAHRGVLTLGGERRATWLEPADHNPNVWPALPAGCLPVGGLRLRLQLATPALFARGWLPGWIDPETLEGRPPGMPDLALTLVSAAVPRRIPISGWDMRANGRKPGPKATRYAVPAGAVYFFETAAPLTDAHWQALWLRPVGDDSASQVQDECDGYGLVLPGVWEEGIQ